MKKVLALMLVLCVVSMANAVTMSVTPATSTFNVADMPTLSIAGNGEKANFAVYLIAEGVGMVNGATATNSAVSEDGVLQVGLADSDWSDAVDGITSAGFVPKSILFIDLTILAVPIPNLAVATIVDGIKASFNGQGVAKFTMVDSESFQVLGSKTVNVIPEPATMALLGLGGLFFARKK